MSIFHDLDEVDDLLRARQESNNLNADIFFHLLNQCDIFVKNKTTNDIINLRHFSTLNSTNINTYDLAKNLKDITLTKDTDVANNNIAKLALIKYVMRSWPLFNLSIQQTTNNSLIMITEGISHYEFLLDYEPADGINKELPGIIVSKN